MKDVEVPVLIAGGSLVGMSAALLLGHHGVRAMAIERHRGTAIHPRAAQITQRTMEIFRTVGVEQIVSQKSSQQFVQDGAIMAVDRLAGKELAHYIANLNDGVRDVSPCERVFINQNLLEPLLKQRAEALGADLRFGSEIVHWEQDARGVTARVRERDSGQEYSVRAQYMIAADGAHSRIRERLGIPVRGHGVFSNSVTIYFHADVNPLLRGRNLSVIYVLNPVLRGFFRFEKPFHTGFLAINAVGDPEHPITDVASLATPEQCMRWVQEALGSTDVPVAIDNVMHWQAEANWAERLREGRIFLAGDAAHTMPPNGGYGGNTGIQDAHNLAWKLAWVLRGEAGAELLDTYHSERQPVGEFTTEQAYSRYVVRTAPYLGTEGMQPVAPELNIELGYCYQPFGHENPRESKARPGTRAPHFTLADGRSTLDFFGRGFVLLAGPQWNGGAGSSPANLEVQRIGDPGFAAAYGISPSGAALVRPDGFVTWRGEPGQSWAEELRPLSLRAL